MAGRLPALLGVQTEASSIKMPVASSERVAGAAACACKVPDVYLETYGALHILQAAGIYDLIKAKLHDSSDDTLTKVLRVLEDPGVAGDMFSSAASYDPTFWAVHGTLERILSLKRARMEISPPANPFDDTWGFSTANTRYLMGICDWSQVTDPATDLTLPTCNMDPGDFFLSCSPPPFPPF